MSLGDLPPRQKMINLMYLVLLCLLAMNVSKEILHSFLIINGGLERTTDNFESKINDTYAQFKKAYNDDPKKVEKFWNNAKKAKSQADDIIEHIKLIKSELLNTVDQKDPATGYGDTVKLENVQNLDNQDVGAQIMIGPDSHKPCEDKETCALVLKKKIEEFNALIAGIFPDDPHLVEELQIPLEKVKQHDTEEDWEIANFYHLPMAATITNLTRFQAAVRNSEADIIKYLMSNIRADDFAFDALDVQVIPRNGTYITQGDSFIADVVVAAYSTTQNPLLYTTTDIKAGFDTTNKKRPEVIGKDTSNVFFEKDGIASYGVKASTLGEQEWGGVLKVKKPDGSFVHYKFEHKYMVAKPSLVVAPTKMNVFYKGLANPVDISVSGIASEKLTLSVAGCSVKPINKSQGKYEVVPNAKMKAKEVKVTVTATIDGKKQTYPAQTYRLKTVPKPIPYFNGKTGSIDMKKSQLVTGQFISSRLDDFLFDLKYKTVSFEMFVSVGGKSQSYRAKGGRLTNEMKSVIRSMKPGQTVIFQKVVAKMDRPGAQNRPLDGNIIIHVK